MVFQRLISGTLVAALMASAASADTLREALVSAYQTNPTLTAQREALRATAVKGMFWSISQSMINMPV